MEVVRRVWSGRVVPLLTAIAARVGDFFEEWAFRTSLAFDVLAGRLPMVRPRRWWNRATEPPTLIDVYDWTAERLIYSVMVWPRLEDPVQNSHRDHRERVRQVLEVLHAGATDMAWCTRYEVDRALRWDHERQVWVGFDGFAFDGGRLREYVRNGTARR